MPNTVPVPSVHSINSIGGLVSPQQSVQPIRQARYWLLTIPGEEWQPSLPESCAYIKGQREVGPETGYVHWQVLCIFKNKIRLRGVKSVFGPRVHAEPTRSAAADEYVWKEATRVAGSQFELGIRPTRRNSKSDWQQVWDLAVGGRMLDIEPSIRVQVFCFNIALSHLTQHCCRLLFAGGYPADMRRLPRFYWNRKE